MLQYHLAVMCSETQRRAPFLECDFIVGNIAGDHAQPDELVEAATGNRLPLRPGARERLVREGYAVSVRDAAFVVEDSPSVWMLGRKTAATEFLKTLIRGVHGERRLSLPPLGRIVSHIELLFVPPEGLLCRLAAARLARTMASEAVEFQLQEAAAAAEVAYALAVRPPEKVGVLTGATRDADLYRIIASAYSVSGRFGPVSKELFEPTADRSSRDLVPNIGDFLA